MSNEIENSIEFASKCIEDLVKNWECEQLDRDGVRYPEDTKDSIRRIGDNGGVRAYAAAAHSKLRSIRTIIHPSATNIP